MTGENLADRGHRYYAAAIVYFGVPVIAVVMMWYLRSSVGDLIAFAFAAVFTAVAVGVTSQWYLSKEVDSDAV